MSVGCGESVIELANHRVGCGAIEPLGSSCLWGQRSAAPRVLNDITTNRSPTGPAVADFPEDQMKFHRSRTARRAAIAVIAVGGPGRDRSLLRFVVGIGRRSRPPAGEPQARRPPDQRRPDPNPPAAAHRVRRRRPWRRRRSPRSARRRPSAVRHISPTAPVTISVSRGTISQLSFTNPEGTAVNGTLSADQTSWTLAEPLGYGRTYTVAGYRGRHRRQVRCRSRQLHDRRRPSTRSPPRSPPATATWSASPRRSSCTSATSRRTRR